MKIVLFCLFGLCTGGPTLYRLSTGEEETAEEIRIPVSSTGIRIQYRLGYLYPVKVLGYSID